MNKSIKKIYLGLIGLVIAVGIVDCKQDSVLMPEPESDPHLHGVDTPSVGTVMYSELLRDNQLIEQSVDSLVNLGSKEEPAYFVLKSFFESFHSICLLWNKSLNKLIYF